MPKEKMSGNATKLPTIVSNDACGVEKNIYKAFRKRANNFCLLMLGVYEKPTPTKLRVPTFRANAKYVKLVA